jgi:hypothetical protein
MKSSKSAILKKTALATLVAGTLGAAAIPAAQANVVNFSYKGAFTMLTPTSAAAPTAAALLNSPGDYVNGFYAVAGPTSGPATTFGWKGIRTPITGTMSFDTSTGAGVATVNAFQFFNNTTNGYAKALGVTFQTIDSVGTLVGGMLFSWNKGSHSVSIVMDAGQMFQALPGLLGAGPTNSVSGTYSAVSNGALGMNAPTTDITTAIVRTSTLNTASGCDGLSLATQANAYTINTNFANLGTCTNVSNGFGVNDGIGGDPMTSSAFDSHNGNFDILSVHLDSFVPTPQAAVPVPAAVWLFGSGLLGLVGIARRKKKA